MEKEINKSIDVLLKGGIIVYPTDTIWGIGCDATNSDAVDKLYRLKKREGDKTFILLLDDAKKLDRYVEGVSDCAYDLMKNWNKPLTIIYPNAKPSIDEKLIREDGTVAIRITNDEFSKRLIKELDRPIVSTSANFAGTETPLYFKMIDEELLEKCDYVVDLYHDKVNELKASTIIRIKPDCSFEVLRP